MKQVRQERSNWRDEWISKKHREWGWDCPAVDVDFLLIEYDHSVPKAIIEYKEIGANPQRASHPSYKAIISLANIAKLPFWVVRYKQYGDWYKVIPLNGYATYWTPNRVAYNESQYVNFLHTVRNTHRITSS